MKISQIGSKQFIHDPPSFTNYHLKKHDKKNLNDQYSMHSTLNSKIEDAKHLLALNDTSAIMKTAQDIERIRRETDFIKETGTEPPTWRTNSYNKLNII